MTSQHWSWRRSRSPRVAIGALVALATLGFASAVCAQSFTDTSLVAVPVVTGLASPTSMVFIGPDELLICQKENGRVRHVLNGVFQTDALDLAVNYASERGLLGIALHPSFATNGWVYLYYTPSTTTGDTQSSSQGVDNRIVRYTWNGSALVSPQLIVRLNLTPGPNHDGGVILFGPDGKLYAVIGDLNRNGKEQNYPAGPAPDSTGNILRMNDDGSAPADNPFAGQAGMALVHAYGIRNSFGLAFDPVSGVLWESENGPTSYDEVNRFPGGSNGGWEQILGPDARDPQGLADLWTAPGATYVDPVFSWLNVVAPTAVAFLATDRYGPAVRDHLLVGDYLNGKIYRFPLNPARTALSFTDPLLFDLVADSTGELASVTWGMGFSAVTDLRLRSDGLLHVLSIAAGTVWRIDNTATTVGEGGAGRGVSFLPLPSPRRGDVTLRWTQSAPGTARVTIVDAAGRRVRVLSDAAGGAGERALLWDGTDARGARVPAGVYTCRLEVTGARDVARLVRLP